MRPNLVGLEPIWLWVAVGRSKKQADSQTCFGFSPTSNIRCLTIKE